MMAPADGTGFFPRPFLLPDAEGVPQTGHPKVQLLSFECHTISMTTSNQQEGEKLESA